MVSSTKHTTRRRALVAARRSRHNKRGRFVTPSFPLQPEGYDPTAADAKKPAKA